MERMPSPLRARSSFCHPLTHSSWDLLWTDAGALATSGATDTTTDTGRGREQSAEVGARAWWKPCHAEMDDTHGLAFAGSNLSGGGSRKRLRWLLLIPMAWRLERSEFVVGFAVHEKILGVYLLAPHERFSLPSPSRSPVLPLPHLWSFNQDMLLTVHCGTVRINRTKTASFLSLSPPFLQVHSTAAVQLIFSHGHCTTIYCSHYAYSCLLSLFLVSSSCWVPSAAMAFQGVAMVLSPYWL